LKSRWTTALYGQITTRAPAQQLDGHPLQELIVGPHRFVDRPHPARAGPAHQLRGPEAGTQAGISQRLGGVVRIFGKEPGEGVAAGGGALKHFLEKRLHFPEAVDGGGRGGAHISRRAQPDPWGSRPGLLTLQYPVQKGPRKGPVPLHSRSPASALRTTQ